ncbi:MAG: flavin reductase family protein [Ruminococcaceae bacterium]|jgi:flavin reductase (DIM6/NTAB) family NADH-FMN oxidoreductase RutF|nr:flavin reductase family protein [Oscillospiraceae bacterium]
MRKDLGVKPAVYPMPVLMIATYDENGTVDVMNAAWGMICDSDKVTLALTETHKTVKNIKINKAFTVSLADVKTIREADFFGIASGNTMADKFERSGLTATKSDKVNAPIVEEFPVTMECELAEIIETDNVYSIIGKIVNVSAHEDVLDEKDRVDIEKASILMFDQFKAGYYVTGEKVGQAWDSGKELMK